MSLFQRLGALALALSLPLVTAHAEKAKTPDQYVIISFDGDLQNEQWERSRALAKKTGAQFTYFLSCVYLLSPETRDAYQGPGMAKGRTNVGSGYSREDVIERLKNVWAAHEDGQDIASHACGHFNGEDWTREDWMTEFDQFDRIVADAWEINDVEGEPEGWREFARTGIRGFRAPYLATTDALYEALAEHGFTYDASQVSDGPVRPETKDSVTRFSLPMIPEGPGRRPVIAMDYNLFFRHSGAKELPENAARYEARAYAAFREAFDRQYDGRRIPLQLGFHFTLMNGGAYWNALERLATEVCGKADVHCVSYRGYLEAMHAGDEADSGLGG